MNKKFLLFLLVAVGCLLPPRSANAHVLITDDSGTMGAILHVQPDDDPSAGEPSTLFFDIQSQSFSQHAHTVTLDITNESGQIVQAPITLIGSSVSAIYTFPLQGTYKLELTARAQGEPAAHAHTFTHTQRVSRGIAGSALDEPTHAWAEILLIASMCSIALLGIIALNHRKQIATYSKW